MSDLPPYVEATTYPPFTPRFAASGLRAASSGGEMTAFLTWRSDLPGPGGADRAVTPPGAAQPAAQLGLVAEAVEDDDGRSHG